MLLKVWGIVILIILIPSGILCSMSNKLEEKIGAYTLMPTILFILIILIKFWRCF